MMQLARPTTSTYATGEVVDVALYVSTTLPLVHSSEPNANATGRPLLISRDGRIPKYDEYGHRFIPSIVVSPPY
jgi:hypothetical protein